MLDSLAAKSEDSPGYVSILSRNPGTAFIQALLVAHESLQIANQVLVNIYITCCLCTRYVQATERERMECFNL